MLYLFTPRNESFYHIVIKEQSTPPVQGSPKGYNGEWDISEVDLSINHPLWTIVSKESVLKAIKNKGFYSITLDAKRTLILKL